MNPKLRVSFNSPQSGFMSIGLKAGQESFVTAVSHAPYDSLRDLINALSALLDGKNSVTVKWNREPEEYDFELRRAGDDEAQLSVTRYPNHHRLKSKSVLVFSHKAVSPQGLCEPFWKALRELHRDINVDEFDKNWRREFPEAEMLELTKRLRGFKHERAATGKD
jgi:hypothetical protein